VSVLPHAALILNNTESLRRQGNLERVGHTLRQMGHQQSFDYYIHDMTFRMNFIQFVPKSIVFTEQIAYTTPESVALDENAAHLAAHSDLSICPYTLAGIISKYQQTHILDNGISVGSSVFQALYILKANNDPSAFKPVNVHLYREATLSFSIINQYLHWTNLGAEHNFQISFHFHDDPYAENPQRIVSDDIAELSEQGIEVSDKMTPEQRAKLDLIDPDDSDFDDTKVRF
jgi:hypothetical protein